MDHLSPEKSCEASAQIDIEFYAVAPQKFADPPRQVASFSIPVREHDHPPRGSLEFMGELRERGAMVDEPDATVDAQAPEGRTVSLPLDEDDRSRFERFTAEL